MARVRVQYNRIGNSPTVWFEDPQWEQVCQEIDDDVVLMKDHVGRVIGFERPNYATASRDSVGQGWPWHDDEYHWR